jgi:hypothetical protein
MPKTPGEIEAAVRFVADEHALAYHDPPYCAELTYERGGGDGQECEVRFPDGSYAHRREGDWFVGPHPRKEVSLLVPPPRP